jgi:hypothetical protein
VQVAEFRHTPADVQLIAISHKIQPPDRRVSLVGSMG